MDILKLTPAYKDYIWGGKKLKIGFGKLDAPDVAAESWELACHADGESVASGGTYDGMALSSVIKSCGKEILGSNCGSFGDFPILIKLIDANDDLSVQVHPSDDFALENEGQYGKTEMWYVVDCEEGAFLYYGFNKEISREEFAGRVENDTVTEVLNKVAVKKGDVFFIEPGTVHAIGKGVVIAEIQQNSNLTYRIYDYGRRGADGKARELHIEKALKVATLSPPADIKPADGFLSSCKYFSVIHWHVKGRRQGFAGGDSFQSLLVIEGKGQIEHHGQIIRFGKGDSIFVPAGAGKYTIEGECEMLVTSAGIPEPSYRIGIDIGGTNIKCGVIDLDNNIVSQKSIATKAERPWQDVLKDTGELVLEILEANEIPLSLCTGAGVGCPGTADSESGVILYSNNLAWENVPIVSELMKYIPLNVKVSNDANCAALGEVVAGAAKGCKNAVLLTLGTGIGGGIIINGGIFEGAFPGGAELGHTLLQKDGFECTCGRRGCLEAYASATALERDAKEAVKIFPDSLLAKHEHADSKIIFEAARNGDFAATGVVYNYIVYLAEGVTDIINVFRPEKIIIGGGVGQAGDILLKPLNEFAKSYSFGGKNSFPPVFVSAVLGNNAGIIGAGNL